MRFRLGIGRQKDKKQLSPDSGEKQEVSLNGDAAIAGELDSKIKPADFGSKDEAFFDSQAWLDSDCEDDFVSVDGDFDPSRGSTPNNQISYPNAPQSNKKSSTDTLHGTNSEPSPTEGKKRLAQLLQENQVEEIVSKQSTENSKKETNEKPDFGKASDGQLQMLPSNETQSKELKKKEEDDMKSKQHCCLPRLAQSLSFKERKKHNSGPIQRPNVS